MAKEVYLYEPLYSEVQKEVIEQINAFGDDEFTMRIDSPGGNVSGGWSIISKLSELTQRKKCVVDGNAASMAAMILLFFDEVVVNDTSEIMYHKAAYPSYYDPTPQEEESLVALNNLFREKLEATKMPKDVIERIFKADVRNDVYVTPQQLIDYGIATELRTLDVIQREAYRRKAVALKYAQITNERKPDNTASGENKLNNNLKVNKMTIEELRTQHPDVYAQALSLGATQEKKRVSAFLHTIKVKENSVAERSITAIKNDEQYIDALPEINALAMAETKLAMQQSENVEDLGTEDVTPEGDNKEIKPEAKAEKQLADDTTDVQAILKKNHVKK